MRSTQYCLLFFLLMLSGFSGFSQTKNPFFLEQNRVYVHIFDLIRTGSPALKISYEDPLPGRTHFMAYEASIISDLNANIYRLYEFEQGIIGAQAGICYMRQFSLSRINHFNLGFRFNYSFKQRHINDWIRHDNLNYFRLLDFRQQNHNFGAYLRMTLTRIEFDRMLLSMGINAGILTQLVSDDLPAGFSNGRNDFISGTWYANRKEQGDYLYPHIYFEMNVGYLLHKLEPKKVGL